MNEDTAVSCIKAGATDYVIKEHITRLPYAVKEALEQKVLQRNKETSEKQLRRSETKYRSIFDNIQDLYYEISLDGIILEVSPSIKLITKGQYNRHELIGKSMTNFYDDINAGEKLLAILSKEKRVFDFEFTFKNRDGSLIPCSLSSKVQFNDKGEPEKIIGTIRDITQRKEAENLLEMRAKKLAITQEATINSMAILAEYRDPETGAHIQ